MPPRQIIADPASRGTGRPKQPYIKEIREWHCHAKRANPLGNKRGTESGFQYETHIASQQLPHAVDAWRVPPPLPTLVEGFLLKGFSASSGQRTGKPEGTRMMAKTTRDAGTDGTRIPCRNLASVRERRLVPISPMRRAGVTGR